MDVELKKNELLLWHLILSISLVIILIKKVRDSNLNCLIIRTVHFENVSDCIQICLCVFSRADTGSTLYDDSSKKLKVGGKRGRRGRSLSIKKKKMPHMIK